MNLFEQIKLKLAGPPKPEHLQHGELGERAAKKFLQGLGLKFLAANFASQRGEIDLVFPGEGAKLPDIHRGKGTVFRGVDATGGGSGCAEEAAALTNGAGLPEAIEESAGEVPV